MFIQFLHLPGENPRIRAEAEEAGERENMLKKWLHEITTRLEDVKDLIGAEKSEGAACLQEMIVEKDELICMASLADDPD